jgi:hypothetical protein
VRKRLTGKFDDRFDDKFDKCLDASIDITEPEAGAGTTARQRIERVKSRLRELQTILRN